MTTEQNQVFNLDFMHEDFLQPESIDAVITDPPYFILKECDWDQAWKTKEEYLSWYLGVLRRCYDLLKDNRIAFFFCAQYYQAEIDLLIQNLTKFKILNRCIWFYPDNMAMYSKKGFKLCHEPFFFLLKGNIDSWNRTESFHDLNPSFFMDVKVYPMCKSTSVGLNRRVHESQKPLELMEELVRVGSYEGELVLDPFAGSGTTLVAAKRNHRQYFGFEIRESFIPVISDRLAGGSGESVSPITKDKIASSGNPRNEPKGLF